MEKRREMICREKNENWNRRHDERKESIKMLKKKIYIYRKYIYKNKYMHTYTYTVKNLVIM